MAITGYSGVYSDALQHGFSGHTGGWEDPTNYAAAHARRIDAKFHLKPVDDELMALWRSALATSQYRQAYTCASGDAAGTIVRITSNNTVTPALATTTANARAIGVIAYKETATRCYLAHAYYFSGLSGAANGIAYLSDTGTVASTQGTVEKAIGVFISATEAIVMLSPADVLDISTSITNATNALKMKAPVRVATTTNATLSTAYENGDTVDGFVLATGDRILLKNQTTATDNGIYTVNASGSPTRAVDFDAASEITGGIVIPVLSGTTNGSSLWMITNTGTITPGSTSMTFERVNWGKNNLAAGAAPTANDDADDGYRVGSVWINLSSDTAYICVDSTVAAAVWSQMGGSGGSGTATINLLLNGGGNWFQRTTPTTATTVADDNFGPDRWNVVSQSASFQVSRDSTVRTDNTKYSMKLTNNTGVQSGVGIVQFLENTETRPLLGRTVVCGGKIALSDTINPGGAQVELLGWSGTADSVTSDVVSNWTTDTRATGWSVIASASTDSDGEFQELAITPTAVPTWYSNLAVFFKTTAYDGFSTGMANGESYWVTEAGLYIKSDSGLPNWTQRPLEDELNACQRYYEKSGPVDLAPAASMGTSGAMGYYARGASLTDGVWVHYRAIKRSTAPTITTYNPSAAGSAWRNQGAGADSGAATVRDTSDQGFLLENAGAAGDASNNRINIQWSSAAEL